MSKRREGNQNSLLSRVVIIDHEAYVDAELCAPAILPDYLQLPQIDALMSKSINSYYAEVTVEFVTRIRPVSNFKEAYAIILDTKRPE